MSCEKNASSAKHIAAWSARATIYAERSARTKNRALKKP